MNPVQRLVESCRPHVGGEQYVVVRGTLAPTVAGPYPDMYAANIAAGRAGGRVVRLDPDVAEEDQ